jgi:hypothetical protein
MGSADGGKQAFMDSYGQVAGPSWAGQGGLRSVGRVTAVTKRKRPANSGGREPGAVGWWLGLGDSGAGMPV